MKTTITLDTEVKQRLREAMQQQGKSLKETLNEALRRGLGLSQQQFEASSRVPFACVRDWTLPV